MSEARAALVAVSYNVRRCIGTDGRHDPARIATVLRELEPDVVALQELSTRDRIAGDVDQPAYLAEACGLRAIPGPILRHGTGSVGNALLTRFEPLRVERLDLSVPGREPRGGLDVTLELPGHARLRVLATHLGLSARERRLQLERLLARIDPDDPTPLLVMGDMNEWRRGLGGLARLDRALGRPRRVPTFPSRRPLLALDRIWTRPAAALARVEAHRSDASRVASDHLPLAAVIELPATPSPALRRRSAGCRAS
jgi:endonuclease/exonuclease/phosphatase family metal-dependent hydrolase